MTVKELMHTRNLVFIRIDDDLATAGEIMRWAGVRHLPVLADTRVVGVLTARDLLRHQSMGAPTSTPVRAFMTPDPVLISPDEPIAAACALMVAHGIGCLPVIEKDTLVGIITTADLLGAQIGEASHSPQALRLKMVMRRNPVTVFAHTPLLEAVALMSERDIRHIPVVDGERRVLGILSDRDVRTAIGDPEEALEQELPELEEMRVSSVMTPDVLCVPENAALGQVATLFVNERVGALPVVDESKRLVGVVSYIDVLRAFLPFSSGNQLADAQDQSAPL